MAKLASPHEEVGAITCTALAVIWNMLAVDCVRATFMKLAYGTSQQVHLRCTETSKQLLSRETTTALAVIIYDNLCQRRQKLQGNATAQ